MSGSKSNQFRLALNAADTKPNTGGVSDAEGKCPLVDKHPPVFIDAHMHIQSGACAPLAPLHARMAKINLSRSTIDSMGTWWIVKLLATHKIGDVSPKPTDKIGDIVVEEYDKLAKYGMPAQNSFLGICIVLTMDMDFCHIDGYEGLPVYFHDTDPQSKHVGERYYLKRKTATQPRETCKRVYLNWREDWPLDVEEKNREIREIEGNYSIPEADRKERILKLEAERKRTIIDLAKAEYASKNPYSPPMDETGIWAAQYAGEYEKAQNIYCEARAKEIEDAMARTDFIYADDQTLDKFLKDLNTSLFETWKQQLMRTERAAVKHPLRLLPMYHYEPRRYVKEDGKAPFKQLVEQGGVYVGFKMYTSQGYMPKEDSPLGMMHVGGIAAEFFKDCAAQKIPVMAHCTPAGFYTHQRELYIELASEENQKLYSLEGDKKWRDTDRLRYFQEQYVHPEAWRKVLDDNKELYLCLAHFASDKMLWNDDPKEFKKTALTKGQMNDFFKRMDKYNDWLALSGMGRLSGKALLDSFWETNPYPGYAKPSIDNSDVIYGKGWIRSIVEMCAGQYPNFYTDISYLPLFEHIDSWGLFKKRRDYWHVLGDILKEFPYMVDRIMFGTDWYMILLEPHLYDEWFNKVSEALAKVQDYVGGQFKTWNLFHQFAIVNPIKFYRLYERHPMIESALKSKISAGKGGENIQDAMDQLTRRYETLKRVDEARLNQMKEDVKKGPLVFTLSEVDQ